MRRDRDGGEIRMSTCSSLRANTATPAAVAARIPGIRLGRNEGEGNSGIGAAVAAQKIHAWTIPRKVAGRFGQGQTMTLALPSSGQRGGDDEQGGAAEQERGRMQARPPGQQ